MGKRFISIWFRHLTTDRLSIRQPEQRKMPLITVAPDHGRMIITASNAIAEKQGIRIGMAAADARAIFPSIQILNAIPDLAPRLLKALAAWCIRFTPIAAIDLPDGLILDVSGCAHLWGGEWNFLKEIVGRLKSSGYDIRAAMADTVGTAWAIARYGLITPVIAAGAQTEALLPLPPAALRLEPDTLARMQKLGLNQIQHFISMPRSVLRRRFGMHMLQRLDQALGLEEEIIQPIHPVELYQERLYSLEPIVTLTGIEIGLRAVLQALCDRLKKEGKGIRCLLLTCYRIDGKQQSIQIGTNLASNHVAHLFKLFELKIQDIEPALGIELFLLEATRVEEVSPFQESFWANTGSLEDIHVVELLDRMAEKFGAHAIHRYLPDEHYWPERSFRPALCIREVAAIGWPVHLPRPVQLLKRPESIEVSAPIPDYPPMLFRHRNVLHKIVKADGPERIESEWWIEEGMHRDYYRVEDEEGARYWIFRLGHYQEKNQQWYIHGVFA